MSLITLCRSLIAGLDLLAMDLFFSKPALAGVVAGQLFGMTYQ